MTEPPLPRVRRLGRPVKIIAGLLLVGALLWYLFTAVDGFFLVEQTGTAEVVGKKRWGPGGAYTTQTINNRPVLSRSETPPAYILELDLEGRSAEGFVEKEFYDTVRSGEQVRVVFQTRRLTGLIQVVSVTRISPGD
jgi:hypothetical protein